jgi:hypothetical protein
MIQFYCTFIYILLYLDAETAFHTVYIISDYILALTIHEMNMYVNKHITLISNAVLSYMETFQMN